MMSKVLVYVFLYLTSFNAHLPQPSFQCFKQAKLWDMDNYKLIFIIDQSSNQNIYVFKANVMKH